MAPGRDDPDRKLFAEELKAMRQQRGWKRDELAKMINFSESTIGNIEAMYRAPTRQQAALLDKAFDAPGTFARLEERIRGVAFSTGFRPFYPYEQAALTLKTFQHTLVPGLFQTKDYARAILETHPGVSEQVVQDRVEGRISRQAMLNRTEPAPPWLWAVLDEHVLNRDIGGPAVMFAQMERLAELARRPRINIQVIPGDRPHAGLLGAFVLAEMDEPPVMLHLETGFGGQTVEHPQMAATMVVLFDTLRMEALTGGASLALIEEAALRLKEGSET